MPLRFLREMLIYTDSRDYNFMLISLYEPLTVLSSKPHKMNTKDIQRIDVEKFFPYRRD